MSDMMQEYTVVLRPGRKVDETLLAEIRAALDAIEGATVREIEASSALGLDRRELFVTALVSFAMTVSANLTSNTIQAMLDRQASTRAVVVEEVIAEEPTETDPIPLPATDDG